MSYSAQTGANRIFQVDFLDHHLDVIFLLLPKAKWNVGLICLSDPGDQAGGIGPGLRVIDRLQIIREPTLIDGADIDREMAGLTAFGDQLLRGVQVAFGDDALALEDVAQPRADTAKSRVDRIRRISAQNAFRSTSYRSRCCTLGCHVRTSGGQSWGDGLNRLYFAGTGIRLTHARGFSIDRHPRYSFPGCEGACCKQAGSRRRRQIINEPVPVAADAGSFIFRRVLSWSAPSVISAPLQNDWRT